MLKSLHIENFALIDELDIDFHRGFSVITGETGAGKSIILGAIGAVLGEKMRSNPMQDSQEGKTIIEAVFDLSNYNLKSFFDENNLDFDGKECIVRREITAAGKSRAFINDTPSSLTLLRELGDKLLDIHSQHQNLLLNKENFQLSVVDIIAENKSLLDEYTAQYHKYNETKKALDDAITLTQQNRDDEDFLRFQVSQLSEANLHEDEQEELEKETELLSHAEEIRQQLYDAYSCLCSEKSDTDTVDQIRQCSSALGRIAEFFPAATQLEERLDSCYEELRDISSELENLTDDVDADPERLDSLRERLDLIYSLQHKHHVSSVEELLTIQHEMENKLSLIDNSDETINQLKKQLEQETKQLLALSDKLTQTRTKAARQLEKKMTECLLPLGMPNVQFKVEMSQREQPDVNGRDKIIFMFSANKNVALQNLSQIASGGEIARVMLSLKSIIAGAVKLPTIIFDEIDTGVSGSIAEKMARIMRDMSDNNRQVISITHLPQIAAVGEYHYRVYKEDSKSRTTTHITLLNKIERIAELANMLSGETTSKAALANAKELLGEK